MKKIIILSLVSVILVSSCSSSKYGCGGGVNKRMKWSKLERHINRP